jgi:hypothetical protein
VGDAALRAADDRAVSGDEHRALHQPRVAGEELRDGFGRAVVGLVEAEPGELRVLADEVLDGVLEDRDEAVERRPVRLLLEVLDDLELDPEIPGDRQGAGRGVSVRVVVDEHLRHARQSTGGSGGGSA